MNQLDIIMDMISNSNFGVNTTQMFQNGGSMVGMGMLWEMWQ